MSDLIKDIYGESTLRLVPVGSETLVTAYDPSGNTAIVGLHVPTADLLAALNAVPAEKLAEAESELAKQDEELRVAAAERDALAKTVERVRELREEARRTEARSGLGYISQVTEWFHKLDAALDPEPAFVLPTEAGAGVMATDSGPRCYEREYRLFADGMWHGADGSILHPKTLMANYIGHRLTEDVA